MTLTRFDTVALIGQKKSSVMKKYHKVNHTLLGGETWPEMYWFIVHWYYSRHILSHEVFFLFYVYVSTGFPSVC